MVYSVVNLVVYLVVYSVVNLQVNLVTESWRRRRRAVDAWWMEQCTGRRAGGRETVRTRPSRSGYPQWRLTAR